MEESTAEPQDAAQASHLDKAAACAVPTSSLLLPPSATRSLLKLDKDVFEYLCAFVAVDDLLVRFAAVSRETRRRIWANHDLWQQLWMRYLVQFYQSLIPAPASPATASASPYLSSATSTKTTPSARLSPWPAAAEAEATSMVSGPPHPESAWRLYHYHNSKEARPRVELLERLSLTPVDIADPSTEEVPTGAARTQADASGGSGGPAPAGLPSWLGGAAARTQALRFAQQCATQLLANNLTHTEEAAPTAATAASPTAQQQLPQPKSKSKLNNTAASKRVKKAAVVSRRRARQSERLRRALHFLLSANPTRPPFHDALWTSTYEAGETYRREMEEDGGAVDVTATRTHRPRRRQRVKNPLLYPGGAAAAAAAAAVTKDHLRPLSWLDNRDTSVKVLLFDDISRSIGDAGSVQAERIKLLATIAHHWRLAYAHQFYLTPTDGKDQGSVNTQPSAIVPPLSVGRGGRATTERGTQGPTEAEAAAQMQTEQQQQQQQSGRVSWEQIYRRFRDDNGNMPNARIRDSLRQVVVPNTRDSGVTAATGNNNNNNNNGNRLGGSAPADRGANSPASRAASRTHVIPSSGNPLFDLHLLTFAKRKHFYAAMLSSTVEVPDGMGAFFATCVSEPFLRWWCWRSRRLRDIAAASSVVKDAYQQSFHSAATSSPSAVGLSTSAPHPPPTLDSVPTTLWVARVCSVHKPQYGTTASDGSFGRPAPIEAAESIVHSSSYSDVTTSTDTLASNTSSSSSIAFVEEAPELVEALNSAGDDVNGNFEDDEVEVDAFQAYPSNGASSTSISNRPQDPPPPSARPPHRPSAPASSVPLQRAGAAAAAALARSHAPRVTLLFPLPHMLAYWFMMHHVTFYSHQVYRRMWGDQEITIAVCSRILSPTGHSVECRLFYSLRCAAFPRMYTKMMFTPGTLPALTLAKKMSEYSPYRTPSTSSQSSSSSSSSSSAGHRGEDEGHTPQPSSWLLHRTTNGAARRDSDSDSSEEPTHADLPDSPQRAATAFTALPGHVFPTATPPSTSSASQPRRGKQTTLDTTPVDSRRVYDLFWTGFGRVEVESGPTIARSNFVRLRVALGLPVDFPIALLWNLTMFASGVGPLILKDHRHSLFFNYAKSFTDVVEEEFGEVSCYGYGARPATAAPERPMANPLDAEVELMRERHNLDEAARALVQGLAQAARTADQTNSNNNIDMRNRNDDGPNGSRGGGDGADADNDSSFSTVEAEGSRADADHVPSPAQAAASPSSSGTPTSSLTSSAPTYGSWGLDSDFSSMGGHSSWRDWHTPESETL